MTDDSPLAKAHAVAERLRAQMRAEIIGRDGIIELILVALFADGHVLLEDYPGSGKTTLAKALGHSLFVEHPQGALAEFRRIQFTPDLLPSDITGMTILDPVQGSFSFHPGPVFAYVVLVDELNRASPKVQSALLEAMAEKQVTIDNTSHPLDELFFVIATQNPLDSIGTYPLPMAQLDRFLFKLSMTHIERKEELEVLKSHGSLQPKAALPRVGRDELLAARTALRKEIHVSPLIHECLVDIARVLRAAKPVRQGVSTRSLVQALPALQALALLRGRRFVSSEDIEHLAVPLFAHRLEVIPGTRVDELVRDALAAPIEALSRKTLHAPPASPVEAGAQEPQESQG